MNPDENKKILNTENEMQNYVEIMGLLTTKHFQDVKHKCGNKRGKKVADN